jgi:hypothetical protein
VTVFTIREWKKEGINIKSRDISGGKKSTSPPSSTIQPDFFTKEDNPGQKHLIGQLFAI